jgi:hypothetical protein
MVIIRAVYQLDPHRAALHDDACPGVAILMTWADDAKMNSAASTRLRREIKSDQFARVDVVVRGTFLDFGEHCNYWFNPCYTKGVEVIELLEAKRKSP